VGALIRVERAGDQATFRAVLSLVGRVSQCRRILRPKMRPAAVRDAVQNQSKGGLRNGESFEIIRIFFLDTATVGIHERQRSESCSGPPGSRSRHLGSVSRISRDDTQRPDLLAGQRALSSQRPLTTSHV